MCSLFESLFGKKNEDKRAKLQPIAALIKSERFSWKAGGFFSDDDVVSIMPKGALSKGFIGAYHETSLGRLIAKDGLTGDGKNWFAEKRFREIIDDLQRSDFQLLLSNGGNKPAIIICGEVEILFAPYIPK